MREELCQTAVAAERIYDMRVGVHVSVVGGIHRAVERANKLGCETFQVFLSNPRSWQIGPLDDLSVERFRAARQESGLGPVVVHMPYLPNLASPDRELFERSIQSLRENLDRCDLVGAEFLVMHMGKGEGPECRARMVEGIARAWDERERDVSLLLENTAGQGREMGWKVEELVELFQRIPFRGKCGFCVDFCHAFAAGYAVHRRDGLYRFLKRIDDLAGLQHVKLLHLNDSLRPLGSRVDRHAHIGKGEIGADGFRRIVNHTKLRRIPGILETPRKTDLDDLNNLLTIRSLMRRKRAKSMRA